jgi:hypothetical protein
MPVIRHECPAEEVRGSAINSRATRIGAHQCLPHLACDTLASLAVGSAERPVQRDGTGIAPQADPLWDVEARAGNAPRIV